MHFINISNIILMIHFLKIIYFMAIYIFIFLIEKIFSMFIVINHTIFKYKFITTNIYKFYIINNDMQCIKHIVI